MKQASVRDLRRRFAAVEKLLRDSGEVQITRRKQVIARLLPPAHQVAASQIPDSRVRAELPDFLGRMKKIFGKKRMKISNAALLALDRERF
jgi:antitoxin (DNA-binding transcriptional repressor) of toxin-antitoxin stability system